MLVTPLSLQFTLGGSRSLSTVEWRSGVLDLEVCVLIITQVLRIASSISYRKARGVLEVGRRGCWGCVSHGRSAPPITRTTNAQERGVPKVLK
jgi:hypothetical protein